MTTQEQDLQRLGAWDRYQSAKVTFLACRKKLQDWGQSLVVLGQKLHHYPLSATEADAQIIPNQQLFITAVQEFHTAKVNFERARAEATRFNWPVDPEDVQLLRPHEHFRPY